MTTDDLMTITQAADRIGISREAVWQAIKNERLPAEMVGGIWLILKIDVEIYKQKREAKENDG